MISLETRMKRQIAESGPLTVSQFISLCLGDKEQGYYHHAAPFGAKGDFITAPEVSQMFGEMLSLWALSTWQHMGAPKKFIFCEMGPGRGILMDDMLRSCKKLVPDFLHSAQIILVETSLRLRQKIVEKLKPHNIDIKFADNLDNLPPLPLILIANELLDCLPIQQYICAEKGWYERMITLDDSGNLCFALSPYPIDPAFLPNHAATASIGDLVEISPAREALIEQVSQHIITIGGAALFIDYGSLTGGFGDTLQALAQHHYQDPLSSPGNHDLTSHVDFAVLQTKAEAMGCHTSTMTQADFLTALGIEQRAKQLCLGQDLNTQKRIGLDLERLVSPQQMGDLFKVLILSSP